MAYVYIESSKIHVFPCANRSGVDESSKFTTEFNLSNLGLSGKSYLVEPTAVNTTLTAEETFIQCFVKGYYVAFLWPKVALPDSTTENRYAYLQLNISGGGGINGVDKRSIVANQPTIVPFPGTSTSLDAKITGDTVKRFYGAKLVVNATKSPTADNCCLIAANVKAGGTYVNYWITANQSYALVSSKDIEDEAVTNAKLADKAVTYDKMKVDSTAYETTATSTSSERLKVQLLKNASGNKLKAQLLGLVQTADIAGGAVTREKLATAVRNELANIGKLKIGSTWYTVSADGNTLNINPATQASN